MSNQDQPEMAETSFVVESGQMQRVVDVCQRAARADVPLLLEGETGTGKERLARLVHQASDRREGPFVALNCAALPESLLESELFGHEKGAFTGAEEARPGLFRAATGGTLFLDEVGELPAGTQPRLLRALESRRVRPVGATEEVAFDVRIVAATNRALEEMIAAGRFRRDLYHRLKVIGVQIPPLRERPDDILPLARYFIAEACADFCPREDCAAFEFPQEVADRLLAYPWPGNARELANAVKRGVVLADGSPDFTLEDLPPEVRDPPEVSQAASTIAPPSPGAEPRPLEEVERNHILDALDYFDGNRKRTAEALGIGETTLWRRLKSYGLVS